MMSGRFYASCYDVMNGYLEVPKPQDQVDQDQKDVEGRWRRHGNARVLKKELIGVK